MAEQVGPAYPKWRYKAGQQATLVETAAEEKALGPGWVDSPTGLPKTATPAEVKAAADAKAAADKKAADEKAAAEKKAEAKE